MYKSTPVNMSAWMGKFFQHETARRRDTEWLLWEGESAFLRHELYDSFPNPQESALTHVHTGNTNWTQWIVCVYKYFKVIITEEKVMNSRGNVDVSSS